MKNLLILALGLLPSISFAGTAYLIDAGTTSDPGYTELSGSWSPWGEGNGSNINGSLRYSATAGAEAQYSFTGITEAGNYVAYATYSTSSNRPISVAYTINNGNAVTVNQQVAGNWLSPQPAGTNRQAAIQTVLINKAVAVAAGGAVNVNVKNTTGTVIADSVTLEKVRNDVLAVYVLHPNGNNWGTSSVVRNGTWASYGVDASTTNALGSSYYYAASGTSVDYLFTGLVDGVYRLSGVWHGGGNRTASADFLIDGFGTVVVNQKADSLADDTFAGAHWQDIASGITVSGGQLKVTLSSPDTGFAISDGLRLELIPESSTYALMAAAAGLAVVGFRRFRKPA